MTEPDPTKVAWISLGCPKNLVDSERMCATLAEAGCLLPAPLDEADVIVVNTCGFVSAARDESLEAIDEALAHKRSGPVRRVVVTGCMVSRDTEELCRLRPEIDALVGVEDTARIAEAVLGDGPRETLTFASPSGPPGTALPDRSATARFRLTAPHTAYLRISEGCSHRCTFCTIPSIRGPFRSRRMGDVLTEARTLAADGCRELNLIGQDTTAYGCDLPAGHDLPALLGELDAVDGLTWIRLLYAYPTGWDDRLLDAMSRCERVVPYVDLPLQHIADGILKRMGRQVDRARTEALLRRLRDRVPGITIRTTFIVGFPGETEEDFRELLAFVRAFRFEAAGVFAYSPEPGTPAARLNDQVPEPVKAARREELMLAQQEVAFTDNAARVGERLEVLVDVADPAGPCIARHAGQAPEIDGVCLLTDPRPPGEFLPVEVVDWRDYDLVVQALDQAHRRALLG